MPFTKLIDNHKCPLPTKRDDGSDIVPGDEWQCDTCSKTYRWVDDQRDGKFWMSFTR